MARGVLIATVVCAAFGVGFAARSVLDMRTAPEPERIAEPAPHAGLSDEIIEDFETNARAEAPVPPSPIPDPPTAPPSLAAAPEPSPTALPPAAPPLPPAIVSPASPGATASAATPSRPAPSTGLSQLAYAPILPQPESPMRDPGLAPPAAPTPPLAAPQSSPPVVAAPEPPPIRVAPFPAADVDAMREVIAQMRKGDIAAADAAAKKLTDPAARVFAEWALIRSGQRAVTFPRILAFMEREPGLPTQVLLQRRAEEAISAENRPAATVRAFFANRAPTTVGGRLALARALALDGKKDEAAALIRHLWREDNFSDETETRIVADFSDMLKREDHRARMERYLFKDQIPKALKAAQRAGPDFVALVRARQAVDNKAANAKALLDAVPAALRTDTSYIFARTQLARRLDQPVEAAKAMEGLSRDPAVLVDGDEWWVERRLIARKLIDAGNYKLAYQVAAGHGAESDAMKVEAEFHAGWIALQYLDDPATAAVHFDKAAEAAKMPMSLSRVAYWQGRAAAARKDGVAADAHFRRAAAHGSFYYGQLARARVSGVDFAPVSSAMTAASRAELENDRALRAIDLFLTLDARDLAMTLIVDLAQRSGQLAQLEALGDMLTQRRDARAVLIMGKLAMQRGLALDRHAFPSFAIPSFQPLAEISETAILHAIARQESAFDPRAVSHAGARGLMQLMPATARMTANRYKTPFDVARLTADPAYNARIGAAHLSDLLNDWRGSYILIFAAYNAGSHNVKKWIDANGDPRTPGVDPIDWVERIPFSETRNYVQRVMENVQVYRTRLTPGSPLLIEADLRRGARPDGARQETARPAKIANEAPVAASAAR